MADEDNEEVDQRTGVSRHTAVEINVPSDAVGAVIGSQGSQIKLIQETTKTRISFKGDRSSDKDRVLVIRGTMEAVHQAELMVRKIIVDQPPMVSDSMVVPAEAVGCIIGRNGDTIRLLSRSSRAKITIERTNSRNPSQTVVTVQLKGSQAAIDLAKTLIREKVVEESEFRAKKKKTSDVTTNAAQQSDSDPVQLGKEFTPVYISAVEHPEHFWLQVLSSKSARLDALMEQMTEFYGKQNLGETVTEIREGLLVAAPFEHDDQWYRTEVMDIKEDSVDLYYVDFGDSGFVPKDCIRLLRDDLKDLPYQAVECSLANVKPAQGNEWCTAAIDSFEELSHTAKWKAVMARVVGTKQTNYGTIIPCVQLVDTNGPTDIDIAAELVRHGYATPDSKPPVDELCRTVDNDPSLVDDKVVLA